MESNDYSRHFGTGFIEGPVRVLEAPKKTDEQRSKNYYYRTIEIPHIHNTVCLRVQAQQTLHNLRATKLQLRHVYWQTRLATARARERLVIIRVPSHLRNDTARTMYGTAAILTPLAARLGDSSALANVLTGLANDINRKTAIEKVNALLTAAIASSGDPWTGSPVLGSM
ncbi:hypothetical protein THAOC_35385 [Thalassiosira oceanica]|uniref:Uncharacterized protein n=1 Tax=Thalassiosira oceanica TaxID=159749 RepID=K0R101_THAOC|nr:hypothetical protein THAOC_35385 [Thalassiosira oceanica]|eukprot:EJK45973.1 hypothetical protein THAOC_35385 [Thalassiosira oceanica]